MKTMAESAGSSLIETTIVSQLRAGIASIDTKQPESVIGQ